MITGVVLAVLSVAFLFLTNLPVPRHQVELNLVSQQYLPGQTMKLRIDMPEYLPLARDVPIRADLSVAGSVKSASLDGRVVASARLDAAELTTSTGETFEPLFPASHASFSWTVNIRKPGVYTGVLWIFLQRRGEEGISHEVLLAHPVELSSRSMVAIPIGSAFLIGLIGLGASAVLIFRGVSAA